MNNPLDSQSFLDFGNEGLKMSLAALTVAAHVNHIVLPIDVLTLMDHSSATLRVLLGTIEKNGF